MLRHPTTLKRDPLIGAVQEAYSLFSEDRNKTDRNIMQAALITHSEEPRALGARLGISGDVVEAYDALFYNVYDRKADHMFLRNLVYPMTRLEEQLDEYLTKGNLGTQLLRIGYNKDLDTVLFFAGFRADIMRGINDQQASALFKRAIMVQGLMLAENGFLNYTRHHPTIVSAKAIVQSGLIGGGEQSSTDDMSTFSEFAAGVIAEDSMSMQQQTRIAAGLE
jgi:hypothetical protein